MKASIPASAELATQTKNVQPTVEVKDGSASFRTQHPEAVAQRQRQALIANSNHTRQQDSRAALLGKHAMQMQGKAKSQTSNADVHHVEKDGASAQLQEGSPKKANNTGLPDPLKAGIESLSGMSMDHVKVHYNSAQPAQLNALAYAQGSDIHVGPGQEQHLPHEAWHVVQQAQGRVRPTMQMKEGVPINDDRSLEHEADVMGAKALHAGGDITQPKVAAKAHASSSVSFATTPLLQRYVEISAPLAAQTGIPTASKVSDRQGLVKTDSRTLYARKDLITAGSEALKARSRIVLIPGEERVFDFTHMPSDEMPSLSGPKTIKRSLNRVIPRQNPDIPDPRANYGIPSATKDDSPKETKRKHENYFDSMTKLISDFADLSSFIMKLARSGTTDLIGSNRLPTPVVWEWIMQEPLRRDYFQGTVLCALADFDKAAKNGDREEALAKLDLDLNGLQRQVIEVLNKDAPENESVLTVNDCKQHTQSIVGADQMSVANQDAYHDPGLGKNYHNSLTGPIHGSFGWNFHFAPVVLKDGPDNATFETAAGLSFADVDKATWWWGLYGTRVLEQTFRSQIKKAHAERNLGLIAKTPEEERDPREGENIALYTFLRDLYEQLPGTVNDSNEMEWWQKFCDDKRHLAVQLQKEESFSLSLMKRYTFESEEYRAESEAKMQDAVEWMKVSLRDDQEILESIQTKRELDQFTDQTLLRRKKNHDLIWQRLQNASTTLRLYMRFKDTPMIDSAFSENDKMRMDVMLELFELFQSPLWHSGKK